MKKTIAIFALFLAAFTWGSAFCVLKDTLENVSPIWLLAFRFLLAGIIMTLVCIPRMKKMSIRTLKRGIIMGIVLYFEFLFFTVGLQYTTSSKSSFIIGSYVAILPLIYWVIRGQTQLHAGGDKRTSCGKSRRGRIFWRHLSVLWDLALFCLEVLTGSTKEI